MIGGILKRLLAQILALLLIFSLLPVIGPSEVFAAAEIEGAGLTDRGIGLSVDGGTWFAEGAAIEGSVTGTKNCNSEVPGTSTLTITNNKANTATLAFSYTIVNKGTIVIDGEHVTKAGRFQKKLDAGAINHCRADCSNKQSRDIYIHSKYRTFAGPFSFCDFR